MSKTIEPVPTLRLLNKIRTRVRWRRFLGQARIIACVAVLAILLVFAADCWNRLDTLSLRLVLTSVTLGTLFALLASAAFTWLRALDVMGLAHLLERGSPELAEQLVTLVQLGSGENASLVRLLKADTEQKLNHVDAHAACSLEPERRRWIFTCICVVALTGGLLLLPSFRVFAQRTAFAWMTPPIPHRIEILRGSGHVLRGGSYTIEVQVETVDPFAAPARECLWSPDQVGAEPVAMKDGRDGRFTLSVESLQSSLRGRARIGAATSDIVEVEVVEAPKLLSRKATAMVPSYIPISARPVDLDSADFKAKVLQYSRISFEIALDRRPRGAALLLNSKKRIPLTFKDSLLQGELHASECGEVQAELQLTLKHGLVASLPLGGWLVHADRPPSFSALRLHGSNVPLRSGEEYRISLEDVLRLQTEVTDEEGLERVDIEFRVNDAALPLKKWMAGPKHGSLKIDHWLPLPTGLKAGDRVEFRLHATDRRFVRKDEIAAGIPVNDLTPQTTIAPSSSAGDAWIRLQIDPARDSFAKQQAEAQRELAGDFIGKIRAKIDSEIQQIEKLKRTIHQQAALTITQRREADVVRKLNREIVVDLLQASEQAALGQLAGLFLDIAANEMLRTDESLQRFKNPERTLAEGEKDLADALAALASAQKKLERMVEWSERLAQDQLDQAALERLAKRQQDLAERLEELRGGEALSDAEIAQQIEAIRAEQARLAAEAEALQQKNRLVKESMNAMQANQAANLADAVKQLAIEQRDKRELDPSRLPAEIKKRLDDLASRQAELAGRVEPYAAKNEGPDVSPAREAARSIAKAHFEDAIDQQRLHEKRLHAWLGKYLPEHPNGFRDQILLLTQKQMQIRADLEKLGRDLPQLDDAGVQARLKALTARQREIHANLAKLPIEATIGQHKAAVEQLTQRAADQLNAKDALAAFESMEKAQQQLDALAALLPKALAKDRKEIKDATIRARIDSIEGFASQQKKLREETERLHAELLKMLAAKESQAMRDKVERIAKELQELARKGSSPDAKAMAKESAGALDMAQKAMQSSEDAKAKGEAAAAKMADEEASKQLELAAQKLAKLVQDPSMKPMGKDDGKTAEALKQGAEQMKIAESKLPKMTKEAQAAMRAAAEKLADAAQQASKQSASRLPSAARNPAAKASPLLPGGAAKLPGDFKLDLPAGKSWGDLPGQLKTQMIQDYRIRFGDEHAELIQQYFERIAQTPAAPPARKE